VKRRAESGPHDTPVIPSEKLCSELYKLVPGVCLFTIAEPTYQSDSLEVIEHHSEVCARSK